MKYETIIYDKIDKIAKVSLNRPQRMNAATEQLWDEVTHAIGVADKDDDVRVVIITGVGRAFCAGDDHSMLRDMEGTRTFPQDRGDILLPLFLGLQRLGKPTIAMVNGVAAGGGFDLALACDIRVGSPNSRFMVAFTRIGIVPGSGGTWLLPHIVGLPKACELTVTGDFVEGEEAYKIGLLNKFVPAEKLEDETMALARKIAQGPPIALKMDKLAIYKSLSTDFETAQAFGAACEAITLHTEDHKEGVRAFAEKRPPVFKGK